MKNANIISCVITDVVNTFGKSLDNKLSYGDMVAMCTTGGWSGDLCLIVTNILNTRFNIYVSIHRCAGNYFLQDINEDWYTASHPMGSEESYRDMFQFEDLERDIIEPVQPEEVICSLNSADLIKIFLQRWGGPEAKLDTPVTSPTMAVYRRLLKLPLDPTNDWYEENDVYVMPVNSFNGTHPEVRYSPRSESF